MNFDVPDRREPDLACENCGVCLFTPGLCEDCGQAMREELENQWSHEREMLELERMREESGEN